MTKLPLRATEALVPLAMANVLALDQSSHTTGYAIFKNGNPVEVSHFDAVGADLGARLVWIKSKVLSLVQEHEIDEVIFEDIQLQDINGNRTAGIKTFKILAEVFGVIEETLTEAKIKHSAVAPIVWKATFKIAGKGRTKEKALAQQTVLSSYGLKCTEDEADACLIGAHYVKKQTSEFDWS